MKSRVLLSAALYALRVSAAPYIVTSYVELSIYTEVGYTGARTTYPEVLETYTQDIIPTVTSLAPISTYTAEAVYDHLTVLEVVLPPGSGSIPTAGYEDYSVQATAITTQYVVPVTYTPQESCSMTWAFSTNVPVWIPTAVTLAPVTVQTTTSTYSPYGHLAPTPYTSVIAVLNPTDVDADDLASASSSYAPDYGTSYCYSPTTTCYTADATASCTATWAYSYGNSNTYSSSSSGSLDYNDGYHYDTLLIIVIVVPIVGWGFIWFLLGIWENWVSFKGVMLGQKRKRGLPYSWCCCCWLTLCFVGPTYKAKSDEEQAELLAKWKELTAGEKFKLWMKWGFRWKYPDMLGHAPEIVKRPFRQGCL